MLNNIQKREFRAFLKKHLVPYPHPDLIPTLSHEGTRYYVSFKFGRLTQVDDPTNVLLFSELPPMFSTVVSLMSALKLLDSQI